MAAVLSPYRKKGSPPINPRTLMPLNYLDKGRSLVPETYKISKKKRDMMLKILDNG